MAAYKVPRIIQFTEALPKSGSGKIMWRELQELENAATSATRVPSVSAASARS
jgi:fatty-acyl-CoA synthase